MIRIIYYLKYYIYNIRTEEGILCTEVHKKNKNNVENIGNKKKNFSRYPFMEIHREDIWIIWIIGSYISNSIDSSEIFIKGWYVYSMLNEEEKNCIYSRWITDITSL